ncbi:hypothetical protein HII31_05914 [Pseudocercospora fuligena]|uniref:Uncharacterized protein n=1 Tax=Pseudocercospora fuligena TaxID=685502 RepID=A0A8H6VHM3_9PEZI|nr:hypothetical protein HII31_05914 [Pseudocercospora fuligena]
MVRGPFPPQHQGLGGTPSIHPDLWINLVFLPLFTIFGILHFSLFLYNKNKRGVLFPFNAATMGFCATRTIATSLRIDWAYQPRNIHLAMTAQIFVYAGVIILILSNLWWTVRIVRAQHPRIGWSKPITALIPIPIILSVAMIICLITSVCIMFYLPDPFNQLVARRIQQTGGAMFALWTLLPFPILLISCIAKAFRGKESYTDNFGDVKGGLGIPNTVTLKVIVCTITGILLASGATFRAITNFLGPIPIEAETPWYFSKLCFYIFNFTVEFTVVAFWLLIRVDKIFNTPNGAKGPRSYGGQWQHPGDDGEQTTRKLYKSNSGVFQPSEDDLEDWSKRRSSTQVRDSMTTIPALSRRSSWGNQVRSFMAPEDFTLKDLEKLDSMNNHYARNISWGGHSNTVIGGGSLPRDSGDSRPPNFSRILGEGNSTDNLSLPPKIRAVSGPSHSSDNLSLPTPKIRSVSGPGRITPPTDTFEDGDENDMHFVPQMGFDPASGKWVKKHQHASTPMLRRPGYEEGSNLRPWSSQTFMTAEEEKRASK